MSSDRDKALSALRERRVARDKAEVRAESQERQDVRVARSYGATWAEIADMLGIAKQNAWRKFR